MHIAIIMDGNGRWAGQRGLARPVGHRAGARAVRRAVEFAAREEIDTLTLYAFSSDNWSRPREETENLMRLLKHHLLSETARCVQSGVRVEVIGRRDRLPGDLADAIEQTENLTRNGKRLRLRLAIDYSSRRAIRQAARGTQRSSADLAGFEQRLAGVTHTDPDLLDVDLLIRTGGERRLSDFLLWECAYAELIFLDRYWPDFSEIDFAEALRDFHRRQRRFGALPDRPPLHAAGTR